MCSEWERIKQTVIFVVFRSSSVPNGPSSLLSYLSPAPKLINIRSQVQFLPIHFLLVLSSFPTVSLHFLFILTYRLSPFSRPCCQHHLFHHASITQSLFSPPYSPLTTSTTTSQTVYYWSISRRASLTSLHLSFDERSSNTRQPSHVSYGKCIDKDGKSRLSVIF